MNISNVRGHKLIGAALFGLCLFAATPNDAQAFGWGWWGGGGYCCRNYVTPVYYRPVCNTCWRNTYYVPVRRACCY